MTDRNAEELLPWYVNGTLSADEKETVEASLAESEELREQLAFMKMLEAEAKAESAPDASELGWRRLKKELKNLDEQNGPTRNWFRPAVAVAAVLVVALQINILNQPQTDSSYELLSGDAAWMKSPHWIVQLEFKERASWQQMQDLLSRSGAQIVEGPSAVGIVRVAVPRNSDQFTDEQALVNWLREQSVVAHAAAEQ